MTTPPLMWQAFQSLARFHPTSADGAWLLRLAMEPGLDLTEHFEHHSLLSAALTGWPTQREPTSPEPTPWPIPGEPWPADVCPSATAIAAALVWRGQDPFEHLLTSSLVLGTPRIARSAPVCPLVLAIEANLPHLVTQMLRLPSAPSTEMLNTLRTERGDPWLHACLVHRPAIAQVLLTHGLDPNLEGPRGETPLKVAPTPEAVTALLAAGARPSAQMSAQDMRMAWKDARRPRSKAMEAALIKGLPGLQQDAEQVRFQRALDGLKLTPAQATPAVAMPGLDQELSMRSVAFLGLLLSQPLASQKGLRFEALHSLEREPWTTTDRDWALTWMLLRGPEAEPIGGYEDAPKVARRERLRAEFARLQAQVGQPSLSEAWAAARRTLPHLGAWVAAEHHAHPHSTGRLSAAHNTVMNLWAERVPPAEGLTVCETWPGRPLLEAFASLSSRNDWRQALEKDSSTEGWPQVFRYATAMLRHTLPREFAPFLSAQGFHRRWTQLDAQAWRTPSPERDRLIQEVATLPADHPLRAQMMAFEREVTLAQRAPTPSRLRRRS